MTKSTETGFVYILRSKRYVKVGFSRRPYERCKQHDRSTPKRYGKLRCLGCFVGTRSDEKSLQQRFSSIAERPIFNKQLAFDWFIINRPALALLREVRNTLAPIRKPSSVGRTRVSTSIDVELHVDFTGARSVARMSVAEATEYALKDFANKVFKLRSENKLEELRP